MIEGPATPPPTHSLRIVDSVMLGPFRSVAVLCFVLLPLLLSPVLLVAQDDSSDSESASRLLQFDRDVWPILESKCLECHGPEDAKNDFRVDDEEGMMDYIEAGDAENSSLWTDYLVTDDEDLHMPPASKPQLTAVELATIRVWINEGAEWMEPEPTAEAAETSALEIPSSDAEKFMLIGGLFHPAVIHFPIALLFVSTLFCFLSFFDKTSFEPAAYHCLWIGALGAVGACVTGWFYAVHEGYGNPQFNIDQAIDRHRWLGICVAAGSLILFFIARSAKKNSDGGMRFFWLLGSIAIMLGVSTAGYQGGELTYGEDHYLKEYNRLFPAVEESPAEVDSQEPADETDSELGSNDTELSSDADSSSTPSDSDTQID